MAISLHNVGHTSKRCATPNMVDAVLTLLFIGVFIFGIVFGSRELSREPFSFFAAFLIITKYVALLCAVVLLRKIVFWLTPNNVY